MAEHTPQSERAKGGPREIARLNDWLRDNITSPGNNRIVITAGVAALIGDVALFRGFRKRAELLRAVRDFDTFNRDNDPYGEHDMGMFDFEDTACMWKIDYYNLDLSAGSEDATDPFQTVRVLTVMRAHER